MDMTTYYVLSTRYAGPLDRYAFDEILDYYTVSTKPARTNRNGEPHTSGWFDVVDEWVKGAHGTYPTLEAAREVIQALAPGARLAADGEMWLDCHVKESSNIGCHAYTLWAVGSMAGLSSMPPPSKSPARSPRWPEATWTRWSSSGKTSLRPCVRLVTRPIRFRPSALPPR